MTKQDLIYRLHNIPYISAMKGDELLEWLIDIKYAYTKDNPNEELDELFQKYWNPQDILDHIVSKIRRCNSSEYDKPFDILQEIANLLQYKNFNTHWSYFLDDDEREFCDLDDEELHQLRLRMLEVLTREDKDDKE